MSAIEAVTITGGQTVLAENAIAEFRARLRGELLLPPDPGYDEARTIWNAMIDKRPSLIARCAGAADVIAAVNFARENGLLLSVRGGGHNVAGLAVAEGGLLIDLSRMKGIRVDPAARTVRAEAGLTWEELDRETQAFGLATTGGFVPSTGIAGLTLGGGLGYLMRRFGLACDNLLSVDIVTADGQLRTASRAENANLFWGLRGGGGNFGVVTSFEYRLHPVGPSVLGGVLILRPLSAAREALQFYREFAPAAPDELTVHCGLATSPDGQPVVAAIVCYSGPMEKAEDAIRPLRAFGPVADMVGPAPYTAIQGIGGEMFPPGRLNYWKSSFIYDLSDGAIDTMIEQFEGVPSPFSQAALEHLGGAVSRIPSDETAFSERGAPLSLIIGSAWTDPAENDRNVQWTRGFWEAMRPYQSEAAYINYLDADEANRIQAAYGTKYQRLAALKNTYDPTNLFRVNQNIKPTVS